MSNQAPTIRWVTAPAWATCLLLVFGCSTACDGDAALARLGTEDAGATQVFIPPPTVDAGVEDAREDAGSAEPKLGPPWPVILVHGFSGFNSLGPLDYFFRVLDTLADQGETQVYAPAIPPYNSVEDRAPFLALAIDDVLARTNAAKVHLIAHSQGGLDARYVISVLGYDDRVATLTTVATPHRGTPLADYVLDLPENSLDPVAVVLAWLIGALDSPDAQAGGGDDNPGWRNDMDASALSLASVTRETYNHQHPDAPGVPIFSVAAVSNLRRANSICDQGEWGPLRRVDSMEPLLVATAAVLSGWNPFDPIPNDGVVPTGSMVWGEFLGCVPADHFDEVGQIADLLPHLLSGFDHLALYRDLVGRIRSWEDRHVQP